MRDFGETLCVYKPPINLKTVQTDSQQEAKWQQRDRAELDYTASEVGYSQYVFRHLLMLTLSRGGPIVWLSEIDAKAAGIEDNDWIEIFNVNGSISARAVVSQRVPEGMSMMYHRARTDCERTRLGDDRYTRRYS